MILHRRNCFWVIALGICSLCLVGCTDQGELANKSASAVAPKAALGLDELTPQITKPTAGPKATELPETARRAIKQAEKLVKAGKFSQAVRHLERALKAAPDNPSILRKLGLTYVRLGDRAKAVEFLQQVASIAGDNLELQFTIGRLHHSNKQNAQAILAFRTALTCSGAGPRSPLAARSLFWLGNLLSEEGYHTAALECFFRLSQWVDQYAPRYVRDKELGELVLRPERLLTMQGQLLLKLGRATQAVDLLEQAFRYNRGDVQTARLLIETLVEQKKFAQAESLLMEIAAEPAQHSQVAKLAESLCLASGEQAAPGRIADTLLAKRQLSGPLAVRLAELAIQFGAPQEATRLLESLLDKMPANTEAARFLGGLYARQGKQQEALRLLARLLQEDPAATNVVPDAIAEILTSPTPVDIERDFALKIAKEEKEGRFALYYVAGQLAETLGQNSLAAEQYQNAAGDNPEFLPTYEALANLYLSLGQHERLENILQRAAAAGKDGYFVHYLKGKLRFDQEDMLLAANELRQARDRNGGHLPTLILLARTLNRTGQSLEAAMVLAAAMKADPVNDKPYRMLFEVYLASQKYPQASDVIDEFSARVPGSHAVIVMKAMLALRVGQIEPARKAIALLGRVSPDNAELPLLAIQLELAEHKGPLPEDDFKAMVERVSELILRNPQLIEAKRTLLQVSRRQGAEALADSATTWQRLYEQTPGQRDIAKIYAEVLLTLDRHEQALSVLERLVADRPRDLGSRGRLIRAMVKLGRADDAAAQCRQSQAILDQQIAALEGDKAADAIRREKLRLYVLAELYDDLAAFGRQWVTEDPENAELRELLITALVAGKRQETAHGLLDEWIAAGGDQVTTHRRMKVVLFGAERIDEAEAFALQWIESEPNQILPRLTLVSALMAAEKLDRAQQLLDEWLDQRTATATSAPSTQPTQPVAPDPIAMWAREWSARMLLYRQKPAEALHRIQQHIEIDPTNANLLALKSSCLSELGRVSEAILAMEKAYNLRSDSPEMQNNLGYLYADKGILLDKAERLIRGALAENPRQIAYLDSLAWVFYKKGKFTAASRVLERVLAVPGILQQNHPVIMDHAGDVMWRLGRKPKAIGLWRQAAEAAKRLKLKLLDVRQVLANAPKKIQAAEAGQTPPVAPLAGADGPGEQAEPTSQTTSQPATQPATPE